jgi:hypothetical protein
MRNLIILLFASVLLFTACTKETDDVRPPSPISENLGDLKASDSFTWTTDTKVTVKITGVQTIIPVKSTLKLGLPNGSNIFNSLHLMSENQTIQLVVPKGVEYLTLTYGSYNQQILIDNGQAIFSFVKSNSQNN